eukprot:1138957-Pelagomonas_calceolata.AAC.5
MGLHVRQVRDAEGEVGMQPGRGWWALEVGQGPQHGAQSRHEWRLRLLATAMLLAAAITAPAAAAVACVRILIVRGSLRGPGLPP